MRESHTLRLFRITVNNRLFEVTFGDGKENNMRKITILLLAVCTCIALLMALTACDIISDEPKHVHSYDTEWSYDGTHHWHACGNDACTEIADKAEHSPVDGVCECGYEAEETHTCVFKAEWEYDKDEHWHACETEGCGKVSDKAKHEYVNYVCKACGAEAQASEGLEYELSEDSAYYTVSGIGDCADSVLIIPSVYKDLPVREIGEYALDGIGQIKSVIISEGVVSIGDGAFYACVNLQRVIVPSSVKYIGSMAFHSCESLEYNEYDNASYLGNDVNERVVLMKFNDAEATSYEISGDVRFIYDNAFTDHKSIEEVTVPDSVTGIGAAFYNCHSLRSVALGKSVEVISAYAFSYTSLESIEIPDSVKKIGDDAFTATSLSEIVIGEGVTSVGNSAFSYCEGLKRIVISDSVEEIGDLAFYECPSVESLTIGKSVRAIGDKAFYNYRRLTVLNYNAVECLGGGGYIIADAGADTEGIAVTLDDGVKYIPDGFFSGVNVSSVYISDVAAFCGITFDGAWSNPLSTSRSGDKPRKLYVNGDLITRLVIPDTVTEIKARVFMCAEQLTSIEIPDSVKVIGEDAFYGCRSLTAVYIEDIAAWCNITFENPSSNPIYSEGAMYLNDEEVRELVIPDTVTEIKAYAFCGFTNIEKVFIPASVTKIGTEAFSYCSQLANIAFGGGTENWNKVIKEADWALYTKATTVVCGDGEVAIA